MQAIAPSTHDANCIICTQYRFYLEQFLIENEIKMEFTDCPVPGVALITLCDGRKVLLVERAAVLSEWLPKAYKIFKLPCLNFDRMSGSAHLGQFLSPN